MKVDLPSGVLGKEIDVYFTPDKAVKELAISGGFPKIGTVRYSYGFEFEACDINIYFKDIKTGTLVFDFWFKASVALQCVR